MDTFSMLHKLYSNTGLTQVQKNVEGAKIDLAYYEGEQQSIQRQIQEREELNEKYRKHPELIGGWRVQEGDEWMNPLEQEIQRCEQYIVNARNIINMAGVQ